VIAPATFSHAHIGGVISRKLSVEVVCATHTVRVAELFHSKPSVRVCVDFGLDEVVVVEEFAFEVHMLVT
jgi:hypothetical protein